MLSRKPDGDRPLAMQWITAVALCSVMLWGTWCLPAIGQTCVTACPPEARDLVPCNFVRLSGLEVRAEYLLWWTDSLAVPPLVTTSPQGTPREQVGILSDPDQILFGGSGLNGQAHSGGRFAVAGWFDPCRSLGFELGYTFLEQDTAAYRAASQGDPILARPFVNAGTGRRDAGLVAYPGVVEGSISSDAATRFHAAEALLTRTLADECQQRVMLLLGYRFARLEDRLTMIEDNTSVLGLGDLHLFDQFITRNTFNGPQLGLQAERTRGLWTFQVLTKLALGSLHSEIDIEGWTRAVAVTGQEDTTAGGFYALTSNSGRRERDTFSGLTELGLKLRWDFACHWQASLGYSLLYWYYVARAGDQIDTTLSTADFPPGQGAAGLHPQVPFATTGFWAQGLSFGIERRF